MFAALYESALKRETQHRGLLLRGDASDLQQGGTLLLAAIRQGKALRGGPVLRRWWCWWVKDPAL